MRIIPAISSAVRLSHLMLMGSLVLAPTAVRAQPHPRLLLTHENLQKAIKNIQGGQAKTVWDNIPVGYPANVTVAMEVAFQYHVAKAQGQTPPALGGAIDQLIALVQRKTPADVWKYDCPNQWNCSDTIIPAAVLYDWTYDLMSPAQRTQVLSYLLDWANLLRTNTTSPTNPYSVWLENNRVTSPAASLGMILLATNNELNSASDAQAALGALWGRFHDIFYMAAIKPGGNLGEGIKYQRLSLPAVTMFAACAESAGYPALTDTHASNLFDWFLYAGISPAEFIQYGDSSETEMNAATSLWLDYGYYPGRFGNPRQRWAWSYYKSGPALLTPYGRDLGGTAAFIIFNDDPAPAVDMAAQPQSKLFRDKDDVDTGGLAILRDGWDPPGVVVTLLNRDVHQTHQHYDPNALSFSYRGKRFLIDHNAYYDYNDLRHGSDKEHSLVIIDQGGSPTLNHHGAEGCSEYGKVPLFLERGKDAIAVGDARYPAIDLSLYWDANSLVDDLSKVAPAKAAERVVFLLSDFLSTPLIAVADRYRKDDASHVYSLLFQVADGTNPVGDGTLAAPLHLTNSGDELFLFLGKDSHLLPPEQMQDTGEDGPPTGGPAVHYTFRSDSTGVSAQFVSLLLPTSVSGPRPLVSRTTFAGADAYSVALEGDSRSLVYVDNPSASELAVGDSVMGAVTTDATALVLGLDPGGHLAFGAFANYSSLRADALDLGGSATTKKRAALVDFSPAKVASRYTADNLHFTDAVFLQPIAVLPPNAVTAQAPNASPGADPVVPVDAGAVSGPDAGPAAPGGVGSGCACAVPGTLPGAPGLGLMVWALLGLRKRPARPRA